MNAEVLTKGLDALRTTSAIVDDNSELRADLNNLEAELIRVISIAEKMPNGFDAWVETHHVIVEMIEEDFNKGNNDNDYKSVVINRREEQGAGGVWELAENLTSEFEKKHIIEKWEIDSWFDALENFFNEKNKIVEESKTVEEGLGGTITDVSINPYGYWFANIVLENGKVHELMLSEEQAEKLKNVGIKTHKE